MQGEINENIIQNLVFIFNSPGNSITSIGDAELVNGRKCSGNSSTIHLYSKRSSSIGIRAGIGTDINLGFAYGGGINYLLNLNQNAVEIGLVVFGGQF